MVDLRVSNVKLRARGRRLVRRVCGTSIYIPHDTDDPPPDTCTFLLPLHSPTDAQLDALIEYCGLSVKLAIVVGKTGLIREEASQELAEADGSLDTIFNGELASPPSTAGMKGPFFLRIDGGGTSTRAFISAPMHGLVASTHISRSCSVSHSSIDSSVAAIRAVTTLALQSASPLLPSTISFDRVWIGAAGIDPTTRRVQAENFRQAVLSGLEFVCPQSSNKSDQSLWISSDAHLIGSALLSAKGQHGIVLVAGTGSTSLFPEHRASGDSGEGFPFAELRRAGGLGHLLGDEGSAYSIGREALRFALLSPGGGDGPFQRAVMKHFGVATTDDLILAVYDASNSTLGSFGTPKSRIASLCPVVFDEAFPSEGRSPSPTAIRIVSSAVSALILLVKTALHTTDTNDVALAMTGGLFRHELFRGDFIAGLAQQELQFKDIVFVEEPGRQAAQWLADHGLSI
jgi:N-acetylmuramic acid 6-phosphate etherase